MSKVGRRRFAAMLAASAAVLAAAGKRVTTAVLSQVSADGTGRLTISTDGTRAAPSTKLVKWLVEWNDGTTTAGTGTPPLSLSHTYTAGGNYILDLQVTDSAGTMGRSFLTSFISLTPPVDPTTTGGGGSTGVQTYGTRYDFAQLVRGPQASQTQPPGSVTIPSGTSIQTAVNNNPAGTVFWLPGSYTLSSSVVPKNGNQFIGAFGAVIDGTGWVSADTTDAAFKSHLQGVVNNVVIKNLIIRNMPQRGVHAWYSQCSGWDIEYCEIYNCLCGVSYPVSSYVGHNYIHHCNGNSNGGAIPNGGYITSFGSNSTMEFNEISFCGDIQKIIDHVNNQIVRKNWFHHNVGAGIWFDGDCQTALMEDNLIEDNSGNGIMYEICAGATIRYNTIRRNGNTGQGGDAIFISTSRDNEIHNNLIQDNWRAIIYLVNLDNTWQPGFPYAEGIGWDLRNNNSHDNQIYLNPANTNTFPIANGYNMGNYGTAWPDPTGRLPSDPTLYSGNSKANNFDYDHYFFPTATTALLYWWDQLFKSFATWQGLGQDIHGAIN